MPSEVAPDRRTAGILAISFTTLAWGLVPLVLKQTDMPALTFAAYRLWMGVLVYAVVFAVTGRRLRWATVRAAHWAAWSSPSTSRAASWRSSSPASPNATIIGALAPVCITLGAARWFGERVERRDLVFVGASFVGVAIVAVGSAGSPAFRRLGRPLRR